MKEDCIDEKQEKKIGTKGCINLEPQLCHNYFMRLMSVQAARAVFVVSYQCNVCGKVKIICA